MPEKWTKIAAGACLACLFLGRLGQGPADPDLWGYLAFGRVLWETGVFPYQDMFSYMPTNETWIFHEWLVGALFYPIFKTIGPAGLQALRFILCLATVWLVYLTARKQGASVIASALCLALAAPLFCYGYSPVREQAFTFFFFALTLYILESVRQGDKQSRLLLLGPIGLAWANLHGGFIACFGIAGLYCLAQALSRRKFFVYAAASAFFFFRRLSIHISWTYGLFRQAPP